jgi:hypothetical protein
MLLSGGIYWPRVTASDNVDGDITQGCSCSAVNVNTAGTYVITQC